MHRGARTPSTLRVKSVGGIFVVFKDCRQNWEQGVPRGGQASEE